MASVRFVGKVVSPSDFFPDFEQPVRATLQVPDASRPHDVPVEWNIADITFRLPGRKFLFFRTPSLTVTIPVRLEGRFEYIS